MHWREAATGTLKELLVSSDLIGLITDMDGTISPIVDRPEDAWVTARNRALLEQLNGLLSLVAVISGRSVEDLQLRVGLPGLVYVGSHGLERWVNGRPSVVPDALEYKSVVDKLSQEQEVQALPKRFAGLTIENKTLSRNSDSPSSRSSKSLSYRVPTSSCPAEYTA